MWLMLPKGALSIVERSSHLDPDDPRKLQLRARRKEWLDAFRKYCPEMTRPIHTPNADYQWRAFATHEQVAAAVGRAVMDVKYSNFKNATMDRKFGLRKFEQRDRLHNAYSRIWSDLLAAGDGTSSYNKPALKGLAACEAWGHWWPKDRMTCVDCGEPNPSYPDEGPKDVFPEKRAASKPNSSKSAKFRAPQVSAKPDAKPVGGSDSPICRGSWTKPSMTDMSDGMETGLCDDCGNVVNLTLDGHMLRLHWKNGKVPGTSDAIVEAVKQAMREGIKDRA